MSKQNELMNRITCDGLETILEVLDEEDDDASLLTSDTQAYGFFGDLERSMKPGNFARVWKDLIVEAARPSRRQKAIRAPPPVSFERIETELDLSSRTSEEQMSILTDSNSMCSEASALTTPEKTIGKTEKEWVPVTPNSFASPPETTQPSSLGVEKEAVTEQPPTVTCETIRVIAFADEGDVVNMKLDGNNDNSTSGSFKNVPDTEASSNLLHFKPMPATETELESVVVEAPVEVERIAVVERSRHEKPQSVCTMDTDFVEIHSKDVESDDNHHPSVEVEYTPTTVKDAVGKLKEDLFADEQSETENSDDVNGDDILCDSIFTPNDDHVEVSLASESSTQAAFEGTFDEHNYIEVSLEEIKPNQIMVDSDYLVGTSQRSKQVDRLYGEIEIPLNDYYHNATKKKVEKKKRLRFFSKLRRKSRGGTDSSSSSNSMVTDSTECSPSDDSSLSSGHFSLTRNVSEFHENEGLEVLYEDFALF